MRLSFPENFYWGTATSAHQIEGNNKNNDWWQAEQDNKVQYRSGISCDSYNRYEEDLDLARDLSNNAHRFSIEWSRIEPEEGKFDEKQMEHYRKVVHALRERGLEPFTTLHHFTNPIWFADKGGWTNKKAPFYFARYAEYVVKNLSGIRYWITINEPLILVLNGYIRGKWPPFVKSFFEARGAKKNLLAAHVEAYKKIKDTNPAAEIGIAKNNIYFEPYKSRLISRIFTRYIDKSWNIKPLDVINKHQDFVGLNYYFHNTIKVKLSKPESWFNHNKNEEVSDFCWEIYPEGIYHITKQAWRKFKKPIFIFENGVADADDDQRSGFIKSHLKWLYKAIEEGVDVRGYFHWSLLDNFEWAEGFDKRFGLVHTDFETFKRIPRKSFFVYQKICEDNTIVIRNEQCVK
jgi:beta-glucosidase